jgi:hypothetical protein
MAAAKIILVLETLVLVAMALVWAFHLWAPEKLKTRLSLTRHRLFDHLFDAHRYFG